MPSSLQSFLDAVDNEIDLPVIDISHFPWEIHGEKLQHPQCVAAVRDACKEWGFFSIVNHRIPQDLLQKVELLSRQLFATPEEEKDRVTTTDPITSYFRRPTMEGFTIMKLPYSHSVQELADKLWSDGENSKFCETIKTYTVCLEDLAKKITKIIVASLGLNAETLCFSDSTHSNSAMRINRYTSNGKSIDEEVLVPHTDLGFFTILYQDNKGGLQIKSKEGKWTNVKPLPNSFVINVADYLKAWSNGRYRSAEHRVVSKGWSDRISLAYFMGVPDDKQIWAPSELVDEDHPRRYRPFIVSEFKSKFMGDKDKATALDRYEGI